MTSAGFPAMAAGVVARRRFRRGWRRAAARAGLPLALAGALPLAAHATAGRSWVASNGDDANFATNCAESAPCQTFAAAYAVTAPGGEIVALDSAGYGPLTITNAVSIIGIQTAFVKPTPGTTGITINAGAGNVVLIKNVEINGAGGSFTTGIALNSGHLILRNSTLTHLTNGLTITGTKADIIDTEIVSNTTGITTSGTGQDQFQSWGFGVTTEARLYRSTVMANGTAFDMVNPGASIQTGFSDVTILLYNGGTQDNGLIGNAALFTGSGTGCPSGTTTNRCDHALTFTSPVSNSDGAPP